MTQVNVNAPAAFIFNAWSVMQAQKYGQVCAGLHTQACQPIDHTLIRASINLHHCFIGSIFRSCKILHLRSDKILPSYAGLCLRSLSKPRKGRVNAICPVFIKISGAMQDNTTGQNQWHYLVSLQQSSMTGSIKSAGSSLPWFVFQIPQAMASRIRYTLETDEDCTPWPLN
jgi:hypothetical protein